MFPRADLCDLVRMLHPILLLQRHSRRSESPRHPTEGIWASVEIHVSDLARLFNSLDPSPFWDRDLAKEAADFIEGEFEEKRADCVWHLRVNTARAHMNEQEVQTAVRSHYEREARSMRLERWRFLRVGRYSLVGGLLIFLTCITASALAAQSEAHASSAVAQGLTVLAWLALWRPAESLLYGWIPLYRRQRLCERLAALKVTLTPSQCMPS